MAELAAAGAIAFTDDGRPVASAGLMRRALAYSAVADRPLALHCEEPTLSARRSDARGRGLGRARARRLAVRRGEPDGRARPLARSLRGPSGAPAAPLCACLRRRRSPRPRGWCPGQRRGEPASPLRHGRARAYPRRQREDEPAAPHRGRPARARRGTPRRHDRLRRHRPRAARPPREGRALRGGAVRRDRPRDGVRRAQHVPRQDGRGSTGDAAGAALGGAGARARAARAAHRRRGARQPRAARPRGGVDGSGGGASAPARRTRGSSAGRSSARS